MQPKTKSKIEEIIIKKRSLSGEKKRELLSGGDKSNRFDSASDPSSTCESEEGACYHHRNSNFSESKIRSN